MNAITRARFTLAGLLLGRDRIAGRMTCPGCGSWATVIMGTRAGTLDTTTHARRCRICEHNWASVEMTGEHYTGLERARLGRQTWHGGGGL